MTAWEAIRRVRVVRKFAAKPLPADTVERILDAGRHAGSSKNQQRWDFIVIRDREHLAALAEVGAYAGHLAGATIAIALVTPGARTAAASSSVMWDLGRAAQNMVLSAWELGIGSVPATVYDHALAARLLGLPDDRRCDFLLSFGYPADTDALTAPPKKGGRKPLESVIREERW
ncbi:MAG TPA: nitroreductase family protein [Candidatus Polarisedimenticolia bacterium]|nr:nitroreductase family protein [Candidatus Polarisedimenticolia bacterium]